ncbi:uncharacterized protein LOC136038704 isoform X3 [Artemia franciscana]|uniref:SH2 domain-containing protein n=1 Tax=Artemia franciscana TaxID=6661 RepID=A0AA88LDE0_ARTSF|nr:hypothetical protein QYM36_006275 [Artemia franciscana]KAK2717440.1 hypothetical protein QYM36_006275 [Artemia franciscana]
MFKIYLRKGVVLEEMPHNATGCWPSSQCMPPKPPPVPNTIGSRLMKQDGEYVRAALLKPQPDLPPRRPVVLSLSSPIKKTAKNKVDPNRESPTVGTGSYEQLMLELKEVQTRRKNSVCSSDDRTSNEISLSGETPSSVSGSEEDVWKIRNIRKAQKKVRFDERPPSVEISLPLPTLPSPSSVKTAEPFLERRTPVILAKLDYPFTKFERYTPADELNLSGSDEFTDSPTEMDPNESVLSSSIGSELDRIGTDVIDSNDPLEAFTELTNMLEASIREIASFENPRKERMEPVENITIQNQQRKINYFQLPRDEQLPPLEKIYSFEEFRQPTDSQKQVVKDSSKTTLVENTSEIYQDILDAEAQFSELLRMENFAVQSSGNCPRLKYRCGGDFKQLDTVKSGIPELPSKRSDSNQNTQIYSRHRFISDKIPPSTLKNEVQRLPYAKSHCVISNSSEKLSAKRMTSSSDSRPSDFKIDNDTSNLALRIGHTSDNTREDIPPLSLPLNNTLYTEKYCHSSGDLQVIYPRQNLQQKKFLPLQCKNSGETSAFFAMPNALSSSSLSTNSSDLFLELPGNNQENVKDSKNFSITNNLEMSELPKPEGLDSDIQIMARNARLRNLELSSVHNKPSSKLAQSPIYGNNCFPNMSSEKSRIPLCRAGSFSEPAMTESEFDTDGYWRKPLRRCGSFKSRRELPIKPPSFEAVQEWYWSEELPRGTGCDLATGALAPWFHGAISRQTAEKRLEGQTPGTFLVRLTDRLWGYALSIRSMVASKDSLGVSHFLIEGIPDSASVRVYRIIGAKEKPFHSLSDLIAFYSKNNLTSCELLRSPCPRDIVPVNAWQHFF